MNISAQSQLMFDDVQLFFNKNQLKHDVWLTRMVSANGMRPHPAWGYRSALGDNCVLHSGSG